MNFEKVSDVAQSRDEATTKSDTSTPGLASEPHSLRILIAEDTDVVRRSLHLLITALGHQVDVAADGLEALESIASKSYDLVLLDIQMPRMGGAEVAMRLAEEPSQRRVPWVVGMSGTSEMDVELDSSKFDRFLPKPIRLRDFQSLVSDIVSSQSFRSDQCSSAGYP